MLDWLGQRIFSYVHCNHLVYASCWEDPRADRLGLQLTGNDTLLAITSAGCNVLDYLLDEPKQIFAVDVNFRQNALLQLKIAGIRVLSWEDFFELFGRGHHRDASDIYHELLRRQLDEPSRKYWDRWIGLFSGRRSFYFRTTSGTFAAGFRLYIDYILRCRQPIEDLLSATSLTEQIEIYEAHLRDRFWGPWLGFLLQSDALLALSGIPPQQRKQVQQFEPVIQTYLQRQAERVIYNLLIAENYFWRVYLTGAFTPECCPRYLERVHFERLKVLTERVTTHTSSVTQFLETHDVCISRFVLLDHMDWLTGTRSPELTREWQAILERSTPNSRILWRSLGLKTDFIDEVCIQLRGSNYRLRDLMVYDSAQAESMQKIERVTAYGYLALARWRFCYDCESM